MDKHIFEIMKQNFKKPKIKTYYVKYQKLNEQAEL